MKKRIISFILIISLLMTNVSFLSGCSNKTEKSGVTRSAWIQMLAEQFGMDEYVTTTAYFDDISESSEIFGVVQSCVDWGIINNNESNLFQPQEIARTDFAIETALKAARVDLNGTDPVEFAVQNGIVDSSSYLDANWKLQPEKAEQILSWCTTLYLNNDVPEYENIVLNPDVKDFTNEEENIKAVSENSYQVENIDSENFSIGDVVIFPGTEMDPFGIARKIVDIEVSPDGEVTLLTEEPALEEVCQDLEIATTVVPKAEDVIVAEGVTLSNSSVFSSMSANSEDYKITTLGSANESTDVIPLADNEGLNLSFNINFTKGMISVNREWEDLFGIGENVKVGGEQAYSIKSGLNPEAGKTFEEISIIPDKTLFGKDPYDNTEAIEAYKAGKISLDDLKKELNLSKDQHETEISCMENKFSGGYEVTGALNIKNLYVKPELKLKKILGMPTGFQSFSVVVNYEVDASLAVKGNVSDELTVCTIPVPVGGTGVTVYLKLILFFDLNGEASIKVALENTTKVEYSDGKTKKTADKSAEVSGAKTVTFDAGPGFVVDIRFLAIDIVDVKIKAAVRYKRQSALSLSTNYTEDENNITITRQTKFENGIEGYAPILTVNIGSKGTFANKLKLTFSWTIIGEKNAYNFHIIPTKEVIIWEETQTIKKHEEITEETPDDTGENYEGGTGGSGLNKTDGYLSIDSYYIYLEPGESRNLIITHIPDGYSESDIIWQSEDSSIATINQNTISAQEAGVTTIVVKTSDGMYEVRCTVTVENDTFEFTPLEGTAA